MPGPYDDLDPALAARAYQAATQRLGAPDLAQQALMSMQPPAPEPAQPTLYDPSLATQPATQEQQLGVMPPEPAFPGATLPGEAPSAPIPAAFAPQKQRQYGGVDPALLAAAEQLPAGPTPRSPIPLMAEDAAARAAPEEQRFAQEREAAIPAVRAAQAAERQLGEARAGTSDLIAEQQERIRLGSEAAAEKQRRVAMREEQIFETSQKRLGEIKERMQKTAAERPKQGLGQRIAGALAMQLAGLSDSYMSIASIWSGQNLQTNQQGAVAKMIDDGIQRDIEDQKRRYEADKDAFAATRDELSIALKETGSMREAEQAAYASQLEQAQAELRAIASRGQSKEARAAAEQAAAELELKRVQVDRGLAGELASRYRDEQQKLTVLDYQQRAATAAAQGTPLERAEQAMKIRKLGAETSKLEREAQGGGDIKQDAAKSLRLYAAVQGDADFLQSELTADPEDLAGAGPIGARMPGLLVGERGRKTRRAVDRISLNILRDETGAAIGATELQQWKEARGLDPESSNYEEAVRELLDEYRIKHEIAGQAANRPVGDVGPAGRVRSGAAR
jgi:hypothetical protein